MNVSSITASEFAQQLQASPAPFCIDVRTPAEFRSVHLADSNNIPLAQCCSETPKQSSWPTDRPVYLLCGSGKRAQSAQAQLCSEEHSLILVEGGLSACSEAGIALQRQQGVISLERQVRIAAGTLVLAGVAVGSLLHPAGFALSGFVGAGLIFAGITDSCGMALLLARMPWNR